MLVLLMASTLRYQLPSIVFEEPSELAELHSPIVPRLSAGPCPEKSGERERRSGEEDLAVRAILGSAHRHKLLATPVRALCERTFRLLSVGVR
jgi:hypothetical protein